MKKEEEINKNSKNITKTETEKPPLNIDGWYMVQRPPLYIEYPCGYCAVGIKSCSYRPRLYNFTIF
jgi:hypothetical protein